MPVANTWLARTTTWNDRLVAHRGRHNLVHFLEFVIGRAGEHRPGECRAVLACCRRLYLDPTFVRELVAVSAKLLHIEHKHTGGGVLKGVLARPLRGDTL